MSELLNTSTPAGTKSLGETATLRGPLPPNEGSELSANSYPTAAAKPPFYRAIGDEVEVFRAAARRE